LSFALISIIVIFCGCLEEKKSYIRVNELTETPEKYLNISENELKNFPSLKTAINNLGEGIETQYGEIDELRNKFSDFDNLERYFKYQSKFYRLEILVQT
jgi:hypothetical protein